MDDDNVADVFGFIMALGFLAIWPILYILACNWEG